MSKSLGASKVKRQGTTKTFNDYVNYVPHTWFYMFTCDSWGYKILKWIIIAYIGIVPSFVKFGGQTSKNVHNVKFYVFVLDGTYVVGHKLI